jgi:hypothetical protein
MGKIMVLLQQKLMPNEKKKYLIKMLTRNGVIDEFLLSPSKKDFTIPGDTTRYRVYGTPIIDSSTNQRGFFFLQGVPVPVQFNEAHPMLIQSVNSEGNLNLIMDEMEKHGEEKYDLTKGGKKTDTLKWVLVVVVLNLMISLLTIGIALFATPV